MSLPSGWLGQADNFLGIDEPWCHPDRAGVYVLPAPYEHTSSYILGSDRGPSAIIEASQQVELFDETLRQEPYREWGGVATAATLNLDGRVDGQAVQAIQDFVQPHVGRGKFLVTLTGEHTGALGAIRAHAQKYPGMCVVQIDAHGDLRQAYQDNPYSHASVMARVPLVILASGGTDAPTISSSLLGRPDRMTIVCGSSFRFVATTCPRTV